MTNVDIIFAVVMGATAGILIAVGVDAPHEPLHYAAIGAAYIAGIYTGRRLAYDRQEEPDIDERPDQKTDS